MNTWTGYVDYVGYIRSAPVAGHPDVKVTAWGDVPEATLRSGAVQRGAQAANKARIAGQKAADVYMLVGFTNTPAVNVHPQAGENFLRDVLMQREAKPLYGA